MVEVEVVVGTMEVEVGEGEVTEIGTTTAGGTMAMVSPGEDQEEEVEEEEEGVSTIEVGVVVIINSPAVEDVVEDVEGGEVVVEAMVTTHPAMGLVTKAVADQSDRLGTVNK